MSKRILIISDYVDKDLGWIENYIWTVKTILESIWFELKIVWYKVGKSRIKRLFFLILSFLNLHWFFLIKKEINNFKPDVIRFHSVSRAFWPLSILSVKNFKWKILMMYHDLWYFHPFADKVYDENNLVLPFNFKNWLKSLNWFNLLAKIYWIFKYFKLFFLRKILINYVHFHLVPSDFMVNILVRWWINRDKVVVLKHFTIMNNNSLWN